MYRSSESNDYVVAMIIWLSTALLLAMPGALGWQLERDLVQTTFELAAVTFVGGMAYGVMAYVAYRRTSRDERRRYALSRR